MIYTEELQKAMYFKLEHKDINNIETLFKKEDYNGVRLYMEKLLDDRSLFFNGKIRLDEFSKKTYANRKEIYSLFMNEYIKHLDANNNRRR